VDLHAKPLIEEQLARAEHLKQADLRERTIRRGGGEYSFPAGTPA